MRTSTGARLLAREQRLEQGGRTRQHRDMVIDDAPQHDVGVEHRLRQDGGAAQQACEPARLVAEGMEERVDDQVAIAMPQTDDRGPRIENADVLRVRAHHALRLAGGARGEENVGDILGAQPREPRIELRAGNGGAGGEEFVPFRAVDHDASLEARQRFAGEQVRISPSSSPTCTSISVRCSDVRLRPRGVLSGTTMPPTACAPSAAIQRPMFGAQIATRSPCPSPVAMKPAAADRSSSSR